LLEVGLLTALMCKYAAEECQLGLYSDCLDHYEVDPSSNTTAVAAAAAEASGTRKGNGSVGKGKKGQPSSSSILKHVDALLTFAKQHSQRCVRLPSPFFLAAHICQAALAKGAFALALALALALYMATSRFY
jgi:hypothetical protein